MFDHMEETLTKTKREKQKFLGQYIETGWILNWGVWVSLQLCLQRDMSGLSVEGNSLYRFFF